MLITIFSIAIAIVFAYLLIRQKRKTISLYRDNLYLTEISIEAVKQNKHIATLVKRYLHSTSFKEDQETMKEMDAWLEHYNTLYNELSDSTHTVKNAI